MKKLFRLLAVVYSSISLVGCYAKSDYIEETTETVIHYWNVESITFAATSEWWLTFNTNDWLQFCDLSREPRIISRINNRINILIGTRRFFSNTT